MIRMCLQGGKIRTMANDQDDKTVDRMIEELDDIFIKDYLKCKKDTTWVGKIINKGKRHKRIDNSYRNMITKIEEYKNQNELKELLYVIETEMNLIEVDVNSENELGKNIFVVFAILITIIVNLIFNNCSDNSYIDIKLDTARLVLAGFAGILISRICTWWGIKGKNKEKCFYKFVYDILNDTD